MSKTERAKYKFTVKELADGTPWIALEPLNKSISSIEDSLLGFDLHKGADIDKAAQIARYLNDNLSDLSLTSF